MADEPPSHPSVALRYRDLVESGKLSGDDAQLAIAEKLDSLIDEITEHRMASKSSALGWLFGKRQQNQMPVKGLYIHGDVGRGKTMLMDMFHEILPLRRKRRAHFNDFMADIHDRIAAHRQHLKEGKTKEKDPIPPVASQIAEESRVLSFDEFTVTDIADAMILSRLFSALFSHGVVLVATSNVAPENLYKDGLNRALFEPFIGILSRNAEIVNLDADTDYRLKKLGRLPVYLTPIDADAERHMDEAWAIATEGGEPVAEKIELKGRSIDIPKAAKGFARFTFEELCSRPLGARDYLALVKHYRGFFIDGVPVLDLARRNEAKRFIILIDTLYDAGAKLVLSAEAEPEQLYTATSGTESFEFKRTASRLIEMQSTDWVERR